MLTFYPTISHGELGKYAQVPCALLPVSSWAGYALKKQERRGLPTDRVLGPIPVPTLPACMVHVAADCGGFVATRKWGGYRYSPEQYVAWLESVQPSWAAMMDYCCENEVTSGVPGVVRERQAFTTSMAQQLWRDYRERAWVWVPTVQGWEVADYVRHARELRPLIIEMSQYYACLGKAEVFRVGIGTLCARASAALIREVVLAVAVELESMPLHLWGVKLSAMQSPEPLPEQVVSVDSAAWNGMWGRGRALWKQSPYSQREWCFRVKLPEYEAQLRAALQQPKQQCFLSASGSAL